MSGIISKASFLARTGLCIRPSKGDGHCLLYSVCNSVNSQLLCIPSLDYHAVKSCLFLHTLSRLLNYAPFMEPATHRSVLKGLNTYIKNKRYNQSFGDIADKKKFEETAVCPGNLEACRCKAG